MPQVARVVASIALDKEFDYLVPEAVRGVIGVGSRVTIPFGRRRTTGTVVGFRKQSDRPDLKSIVSVTDPKPLIDEKILELARWIGEYYCAPIEQVLRTVLPGAVRREGATSKKRIFVYACTPQGEGPTVKLSPKQSAAWALIQARGEMEIADLTRTLGMTASPVRGLEKKGLVRVAEGEVRRSPMGKRTVLPTQPLSLTDEQRVALDEIKEVVDIPEHDKSDASRNVLLFGVTGSGKTEVYLQAIEHALKRDRGAIVLVPEIALTPQTVNRFVGRFGDRVAVLHSHLSEGERYDEWHRIREGEARIVVGARSAVFAPVRDLGVIVVDEEHEPSYKQEEAPRYNARDIAIMRGHIQGCAVVLGSATPSLESWVNADKGKYRLVSLEHRVDHKRMPTVHIVDMRVETQRAGHVCVLSKALIEAITDRLARAEQTMLFLNRRGYATSLVCPSCGYTASCDQCSINFTYHRKDERLRCHLCGCGRPVPERCPGCRDPAFKFTGIGTQRVERIVSKCFPKARVQRMDADVTGRKAAYEEILGDFRAGKTDILIGTQMIAKGLHFPNVTLVGVVYADLSLHMPDFRAGERTFQLLAQVAGRAGRGEMQGEVFVQTYTPFNVSVQAARRTDYRGFCDQEIEFRKELRYPPYSHLICVTLRGVSEERVNAVAVALGERIRGVMPAPVIVSDPTPAPIAKAKGKHRYQIILRSGSAGTMTRPLKRVLAEFKMPRDVRCVVDVDALSLM